MDRCVCCGDYVPEGRQVCLICERYKPFKAILRRSRGQAIKPSNKTRTTLFSIVTGYRKGDKLYYYRTIDGNYTNNKPVAYCRHYKGYMTVKQLRLHRCVRRDCRNLNRLNHDYWEQRANRKKVKNVHQ